MPKEIRPISKRELAEMFYPESPDPCQCLRKSMEKKGIIERLKNETNFNKYDRSYSAKQLCIIYDELGYPLEGFSDAA